MKHTNNFTLIYPINIRFPMERANSIQIINTCTALSEKGVKVYLLVRRMSDSNIEEDLKFYGLTPHENLKIVKLRVINYDDHDFIWNKSFYISVILYIVMLLITKKIDFFFLRDLGLARYLMPLKKIFGFKVIYETHIISYIVSENQHTLFPATKQVDKNKILKIREKERYVFKNSDIIFTLTNILKERIVELFNTDSKKIDVLPDGVNSSCFSADDICAKSGIVYIGQLYPWKGTDTLIEAMRYINSSLKIIGGVPFENDLKRLKDKAVELGVDDKIDFLGFLPPKEIAKHLKSAKISVIPLPDNIMAREYTSPLKLFESMAAKTAVVASDLPSIREIITHMSNGILFEPQNPKALAEAVNTLIEDIELFNKITSNAFDDSKNYSWEKRAVKIKNALESLKNNIK